MTEPYNETVRELFADLRHAGDLRQDGGRIVSAGAGSAATGAEIVFSAMIAGSQVVALNFRAFGCPHLMAACEYCCRQLSGGPVAAMREVGIQGLMETLAVPVEKSGSIIVLEDALALLVAQLDDKRLQGHN